MTRPNLVVFTASGTWTKPARLVAIELVLRGGGGGGSSGMSHATTNQRRPGAGGGGGGAIRTSRRLRASELPETVAVTVGVGGVQSTTPAMTSGLWSHGNDGGYSAFGDLLRVEGGRGGGWALDATTADILAGGAGALSISRGGDGGANGLPGQSVNAAPVQLLAGGAGGGSGAGYNSSGTAVSNQIGGWSGQVAPATNSPPFWQWSQSSGGGWGRATPADSGGTGGFPAGGGGGGAGGWPAGPGAPGAAGVVAVLELLYDE